MTFLRDPFCSFNFLSASFRDHSNSLMRKSISSFFRIIFSGTFATPLAVVEVVVVVLVVLLADDASAEPFPDSTYDASNNVLWELGTLNQTNNIMMHLPFAERGQQKRRHWHLPFRQRNRLHFPAPFSSDSLEWQPSF